MLPALPFGVPCAARRSPLVICTTPLKSLLHLSLIDSPHWMVMEVLMPFFQSMA